MRRKTMSSNHLTWMVIALSIIAAFGFSPLPRHATGLHRIRATVASSPPPTTLSLSPSPSDDNDDYDDYDQELPQSSSTAARRPGGRIRPIRQSSPIFKEVEARQAEAQLRHLQALQDPTLLTNVQFADRPDIHPATKRAITEVMGLQCMTEIQAKTYATALSGESVLGRARTGTGKTLAFLLPSLERLLETDLSLYRPGRSIGIVIIVPTRELAIQIADQARDLLTYHTDMDVLCMYGGTKMIRDIRLLTSKPQLPTILVSTPGRLLDHLETTRIQRRKFSDILSETRIVVLDETDRLFETNSKEVTKILSFLPRPEKRQTLLFSATVPNPLRGILKNTMKINYTEVDCVSSDSNGGGGSSSTVMAETNQRVEQSFFVLDHMEHYVSTLVALVLQAMKDDDSHKILVFLPASKLVRYFSTLFNSGFNVPVLEIHSRMSQSSRIRASSTFRAAKKGVLFTSDVSARGIDYPDVTLVVQYGAPSTEDGYIHRLGRTGRAGREGKGLLVLMPMEENRVSSLRRRRVLLNTEMAQLSEQSGYEGSIILEMMKPVQERIRSGHTQLKSTAEAAYKAILAYYMANSGGLDPSEVLEYAQKFAHSTGLTTLPPLDGDLASRLKLDGLVDVE